MDEKCDDHVVTAALNEIYGPEGEDSSLDPVLAELQRRTLKRNSWKRRVGKGAKGRVPTRLM
jgi:hypothetical protein